VRFKLCLFVGCCARNSRELCITFFETNPNGLIVCGVLYILTAIDGDGRSSDPAKTDRTTANGRVDNYYVYCREPCLNLELPDLLVIEPLQVAGMQFLRQTTQADTVFSGIFDVLR